jgi:hypothetical protein
MGPDGDSIGGSVSPHGSHVAVLVSKGSRFYVSLDGVAGPKIETLFSSLQGGTSLSNYWMGKIPVLFTDDGAHSIYVGKQGDEYVIFYDGKEYARGPIKATAQITVPPEFTAGGKHFIFMDTDTDGKYRIVVDGKPGPSARVPEQLVVSPDGEHYAYIGYEPNGVAQWSVVDGRQVNFFGDNLQYTGKNVLLSRLTVEGNAVLLINGKPMLKAAALNPMWISPDGNEIAVEITPKNGDKPMLMVNGKLIAGMEGVPIQNFYFSPDGKRWAALCTTKTSSEFVVIDGKKGDDYQGISSNSSPMMLAHWSFITGNVDYTNGMDSKTTQTFQPPVPGFTPDSSKFVYLSTQGGKSFLVVDDNESDGFQSFNCQTVMSATGNRVGMIAVSTDSKQHVIIDGKDQVLGAGNVPGNVRASLLTFSPGGAHYAYLCGQQFMLDGVAQPGLVSGGSYVFSPDDKHFAYPANVAEKNVFIIDGKIVASDVSTINFAFFSPDGQHIVWMRQANLQRQSSKDFHTLYVDGKPIAHYGESGGQLAPIFEFSPDGVLTFVARTDDSYKRFKITMPGDSNIGTMLAAGTVPPAK